MLAPIDRLIERLLNIFGPPQCDDPDAYIDEIRGSLGKYAPDLLTVAGDKARDGCKFFPRPAELREFIADELRIRAIGKPKNALPQEPELPPPSPEQVERARKLVAEAAAVMDKSAKEAMGIEDEEPRDVLRPAFEKMMRESPNQYLYRIGSGTLTELSKKMAGERDE